MSTSRAETNADPAAAAALPEARAFDPVRFPGTDAPEDWPPERFDFASPYMRERGLRFERNANGEICMTRDFGSLRVLLDLDRAHLTFDIPTTSRDFLLLRLIAPALRIRESIAPGDPVPEVLRLDEPSLPQEQHLYAATAALMDGLSRMSGEAGAALSDALRRVPPGPEMIEQAVALCMSKDGYALGALAPLARRLQKLANAHARVLAVAAEQPDYAVMEAAMKRTRAVLAGDRRASEDLLVRALGTIAPRASRPRLAAEQVQKVAKAMLAGPALLHDIAGLTRRQEDIRDRLSDLATFWRRTVLAWAAVDPTATDRKDIESLTRNAARRLALDGLYREERVR